MGEDSILSCTSCSFTSNSEKAGALLFSRKDVSRSNNVQHDWIQNVNDCDREIIERTNFSLHHPVPHIVFYETPENEKDSALLLIPQGRTVNDVKLSKYFKNARVAPWSIGDAEKYKVFMDRNLIQKNDPDNGLALDVITAIDGDACPSCNPTLQNPKAVLETKKAIEIGHTFYLGTKYSSVLKANFKTSSDKLVPFEMGCYGIGVSRLLSSICEVSQDEHGIIWPSVISPYQICLIVAFPRKKNDIAQDAIQKALDKLSKSQFSSLMMNDEVIIDDRDLSLGQKVSDTLLVGYPYHVIIGNEFIKTGKLEICERSTGKALTL